MGGEGGGRFEDLMNRASWRADELGSLRVADAHLCSFVIVREFFLADAGGT